MSVINKVLRDLDSRASPALSPDGAPEGPAPLTRGTSSVQVVPTPTPGRVWAGPVLGLAAAMVLAATLWWWLARSDVRPPAAPPAQPVAVATSVAVAPAPPAGPASRVAAAPGPAPALPQAASSATATVAQARPAPATVPGSAAAPPSSLLLPAPVPAPAPAPAQARTSVSATAMATPATGGGAPSSAAAASAVTPVRPAPSPAVTDAARPGARPDVAPASPAAAPPAWPDLALEALAQAQRTWNTGARDAAVDFLSDALAGVERAHAQEWAAGGAAAQAPLAMVRELVRMSTVLGHHAVVLELLRRHERLVAQQADLWAVRGSAAQRLAQHADAAQSYQMALRLRPGEPRWMLGVAVSLAAQGQTGPAAEWVEQARNLGPVSADVLAYLRQLGVALRDR